MNKEKLIFKSEPLKPQKMTLQIDCKEVRLFVKGIEMRIDIPNEKIKNYDAIVINGIKFIKEK